MRNFITIIMVMIQIQAARPQGIRGAERENQPEAKAAVLSPQ